MELIRGLHNLDVYRRKFPAQQCVLTIGNFDGVHCGHQMILRQLREKASELNLPATVLIFEPQPLEYFAGQGAPARLTPFREKVRLLSEFGVDTVICLHFTEALRCLSAESFIKDILVDGLGVQHLTVGDDFRFGCKQSGDFQMLEQAGERYGFGVAKTHTLQMSGDRVSSTAVRNALISSDFALAEQLLARPYAISGRVMYGQQLGRTIGVPTANLALKGKKPRWKVCLLLRLRVWKNTSWCKVWPMWVYVPRCAGKCLFWKFTCLILMPIFTVKISVWFSVRKSAMNKSLMVWMR